MIPKNAKPRTNLFRTKKTIVEKMIEETNEKKSKLLEEKNTLNLSEGSERIMTRTLRKRGLPKDPKEPSNSIKRRLNPQQIVYQLKESEIMEDLNNIQKQATPVYSSAFGKYEHVLPKVSDIYTDRGKLFYHNQVLEKGKEVVVECVGDKTKWVGSLTAINPTEIQVKTPDGVKNRFLISQIKSGKYTIGLKV